MLYRTRFFIVFVFIAFGLAACGEQKKKRTEYVIAESKAYEASLFRQNCAICHGVEANGKEVGGVMVPSLRYGPASKKTEEEIYDQIKNGKLPMPAFRNQMSEDEIRRMVTFIVRDLQGRQ